jgi:hypothetical protein
VWTPVAFDICHTVGIPKKKRTVYAVTDDRRRLKELTEWAAPFLEGANLVVVEQVVGSGQGKASTALAYVTAVFAALDALNPDIPFLWINQGDSKQAIMGSAEAVPKKQVIEWAAKKYPDIYKEYLAQGKDTNKHRDAFEHIADAIMVLHAARKITTEIQMMEQWATKEQQADEEVRSPRRARPKRQRDSDGDGDNNRRQDADVGKPVRRFRRRAR